MLKAMIKFCGGCNPRYDRAEVFRKIRDHFAGEIEFLSPEPGKKYDLILIITGCGSCQIFEELSQSDTIVFVNSFQEVDDKIQELEKIYDQYSKNNK